MPTSPQPLFYETSKCVALYLDQSIRLQLFLRCPSFRCIHKNQVLRIRNLKLCPDNFEINGTTYKLGILRRYTNGEAPEDIRDSNDAGGFQHDMDRYGIPISKEAVNETDAEIVERLEQRLQLPGVYHANRFIEIIEILEEIQPRILQYNMRMNNEVPPFTHYLQLTMTTGTEQKVERVEYSKTLNEVKDYILHRFFGLNSRKVQVQTLKIGPNGFEDMEEPISNLALQVFSHIGKEFLEISGLAVSGNVVNVLANLKEVIDMAPPLLEFKLAYQPIPNDPLVESADLLNIAKRSSLRILSGRSNYHIHLHACFVDDEDLMFMMNEWNNNKSRAIRYYSIGFSQKLELKRFLNMFKNVPGAERGEIEEIRSTEFPDCIVIPLKNDTELNVFCQETEDEDMTTPSKPLFYETSKCVTLYLDPNKRLQLNLRCPTFRSIHKTQPLRIRDLKLRKRSIEIDGTSYKVGIITKYLQEVTPPGLIVFENATGSLQFDVDRYGFPKESDEENSGKEEAEIELLEQNFRIMRFTKDWLEMTNLAEEMQKNNEEPPFTHYLQLTIRIGDDLEKVERMEYNQAIKVAKEYLLKKVFSVEDIQKNPIVQSIHIRPYLLSMNLMFELQNGNFLCVTGRSRLRVFSGLHNNRIHLERCELEEEDFKIMMEQLNGTESRLGIYYSLGFRSGPEVAPLLQLFRNFPGAERGEIEDRTWSQISESIVIPLKNDTELVFSCDEPSGEELEYCSSKFVVKMKVEPRGKTYVLGLCFPN